MDVALDPGPPGGVGGREDWQEIGASWRGTMVRSLRHVWAFSVANKHKHIRGLGPRECKAFLDIYKATPGQRKNVRSALLKLITIAMEEHEITKDANPLEVIKATRRKRAKRAISIWTPETVNSYASVCVDTAAWCAGRGGRRVTWPGGSILVRLMWETAADSTDVISWTKRDHFKDDPGAPAIEFDRGKTDTPARIRISAELAASIRSNGSLYLVVDPSGRPYEGLKHDARLRGHLGTLRDYAVNSGLPRLKFDHLRHSAATHAEESGVTPDDARHLLQHKSAKTTREHYLQMSAKKAEQVQRARGIIE
jgi:integrase